MKRIHLSDAFIMALTRAVHAHANGPSAWRTLTEAGHDYFVKRMRSCINTAAEEDRAVAKVTAPDHTPMNNFGVVFMPKGEQTINKSSVVDAWGSSGNLLDAYATMERKRDEGAYKALGEGSLSVIQYGENTYS